MLKTVRAELSCDVGSTELLKTLTKLAEAEYRVLEISAHIEEQRQLIEKLAMEERDTTSAQIILDSLLFSLSLGVGDRHRLRSVLEDRTETQAA